MSFNGSGTFVANSSGLPVVTSTVISSTMFNALTADLATGLSTCLLKDGTQTATAIIPFAQGLVLGSTAVTGARLTNSSGRLRLRLGDDSNDASITALALFMPNNGTSDNTTLLLKRSGTTLVVRNGADDGYGIVDAGSYKVANVAGIDFGPAAPASITVVKGIITAAS